jgi:LPXTG-site transpeptidase (sortase) family protein
MKTFLRQKPLIVALLGFAFFVGFFSIFLSRSQKVNSSGPLISIAPAFGEQEKVDTSLPVRLKIPNISVDAAIDSVGLTPAGRVDVPKGPATAAWFNLGPSPGEPGSAIIDGHSGWKNGIPAVFDNLYKLKKGDKIYVEDSSGVSTAFVVREFRSFSPNAEASVVFNAVDGLAHLNLITCTGDWNPITKTHTDRLVVFTDKEI